MNLVLFFAVLSISETVAQEINSQLKWKIAYHKTESEIPEKWLPATVPGAVQLDVMKAENYKQPYWYADNFKQFDWMEDYFFSYKTVFKRPSLPKGNRVFFHSKGIDYQFKLILNGINIFEQEGMFTYVDIDLTDKLKDENELKIILMPIPKIKEAATYIPGSETYRQNARESVKPAVSYGWDWHPRLVTRGIWDETYLSVRKSIHLTDFDISYTLNDEFKNANLSLSLKGENLKGKRYKWALIDNKGSVVFTKTGSFNSNNEEVFANINNPALWWPNGYGAPTLYQSEILLLDKRGKLLDKKQSKVGFRKISMIMNDGEWDKSAGFPITRNRAPASLEVNGKRIFAKGSNWVHPEIFVGLINKDTYQKQLQLVKDANFNLIRVWGGGITNKESFFDICDEKGILVWQEFPLACNNYTNDAKYLSVLQQEATSIINRLKKHASLAIWSGGNELFNSWSRMTDQSLALRLLNSLCYQLNPQTPFIYTSPLYGMGHGSYVFFDKDNSKGNEVFQWLAKSDNTAYTEFGIPSVANLDVLKQFIPSNELFPPKKGTSWETHHAFGAWGENRWLELPFLEDYFGKISSLENLVIYSQLTQSEGLKFIYEEARRQKPYCSMALSWCFQEPWPTAANNSLVNWPNAVKPAYYQVANACRPVLASISAPKFLWIEGEEFSCELYLLNDTYDTLKSGTIKVSLLYDDKKVDFASWDFKEPKQFENTKGPKATIKLPVMKNGLFIIKAEVVGMPQYNSTYTFLYKGTSVTYLKSSVSNN
ncbi:glycoside hydrolase family 2 protein [Pedobacter cryophilus]|uniref:glycoside hydrolase family 2 protein n=1 Tax=Pedobacter cryophilus TaxID=2571271 RepID=UPI0019813F59|nr:glycoside hydrolase family 2 TIM barrel-domain containing protein [Pedobacter cryophilus]